MARERGPTAIAAFGALDQRSSSCVEDRRQTDPLFRLIHLPPFSGTHRHP
jgi:hypothetical protein